MKYAYIHQHRDVFPVSKMCRVLKASRSGYYDSQGHGDSERSKMDWIVLGHIRRIHQQSRQHYGIVKAWKQLTQEGIRCGRERVARLRREHYIQARRRKRFVVTTRSKHRYWIAPNRLNRDFTAAKPDQVWEGDVTFISTRTSWLYLEVLLDLYSRKVIGWSMSHSNNGDLVKACLDMAITHRQPGAGLIHHADRGSTYAMQSCRDTLD